MELLCAWREQRDYELIRPSVLFGIARPPSGRRRPMWRRSARCSAGSFASGPKGWRASSALRPPNAAVCPLRPPRRGPEGRVPGLQVQRDRQRLLRPLRKASRPQDGKARARGGARTQDLASYLSVLYAAVERYGSPEALVTDGGIFRARQHRAVYEALAGRGRRCGSQLRVSLWSTRGNRSRATRWTLRQRPGS